MGVLPEIAKAVEEMDWMLPTDVQNEAVPLILGGGDVLMAAETGSGKTGAFCLPILQIVWESLKDIQLGKTSKVTKEISPLWLMSFFDRDAGMAVTPDGLRCQSQDPKTWQGARCTKGVTGKGKYYYEAVVSDEGLCRVGWATPQLQEGHWTSTGKRHFFTFIAVLFFLLSETLSEAVKLLKGEYCIKAIDTHKMDQALIFCRTKLDCDNLERYFNQIGEGANNRGNPYSCVCLHGDRKPNERKVNLQKFKDGGVKFLICTDVAARGIDVGGLPFIVNVTLPDEKSNYVHHIGRVGRAERMGIAISLVAAVLEKVWYHGEWCSTRGRNCFNTRLTTEGGCCVWYNEPQYLADIEEHLGVTIQQVDQEMKVPVDEFDGKVIYGEKRANVDSKVVWTPNLVRQVKRAFRKAGVRE
nr:ATP-dependent RNA helicase Ddx1-like [Procambarus clarkii]